MTPHPHSFAFRGSYLVSDSFARNLPLKLCEGQQHVQGQSSHRTGGIELLGNRDEGHLPGVQNFNDFREVS